MLDRFIRVKMEDRRIRATGETKYLSVVYNNRVESFVV